MNIICFYRQFTNDYVAYYEEDPENCVIAEDQYSAILALKELIYAC